MAYNFAYPYQYGQNMPNQMMNTNQPQIQNGGLVLVRSEAEARNYPVAYGNSVTFKDETAPYVYSKTMGFSQLDRPIFEKFKLVKEDTRDAEVAPIASNPVIDGIKDELVEIWAEIDALKGNKRNKKTEVANDEQSV